MGYGPTVIGSRYFGLPFWLHFSPSCSSLMTTKFNIFFALPTLFNVSSGIFMRIGVMYPGENNLSLSSNFYSHIPHPGKLPDK